MSYVNDRGFLPQVLFVNLDFSVGKNSDGKVKERFPENWLWVVSRCLQFGILSLLLFRYFSV